LQFANVVRGAVIGDDCLIAPCACVDGARIGNGTRISHGAAVFPGAVIGDSVFIGPNVVFCNDRWPTTSKVGFDIQRPIIQVSVGNGTGIGAGAIILPGVRIGDGAMIGAGCVVDQSVPDFYLMKRGGEIVPLDHRVPRRMRSC